MFFRLAVASYLLISAYSLYGRCNSFSLQEIASELKVYGYGSSRYSYIAERFSQLENFETKAWVDLFNFFLKNGDPNGTLNYDILPLLVAMPPELKVTLDAIVKANYATSSKEINYYKGDRVILSPQRALATYLHRTMNVDKMFSDFKNKGLSPEEALDAYFSEVRSRLPDCTDCQYSAKSVLSLANKIQGVANTAMAKGNLKTYEYVLFGSIPNGRANIKKSDIDLLAQTDEQRFLLNPYYQSISTYLAEIIPGAKLSMAFPEAPITRLQASGLSPVQIRITPTSIDVEIFSNHAQSEWSVRIPSASTPQVLPIRY